MDRHVAWLKRVALSRTLVRLSLESIVAGDLALLLLSWRGVDRWVSIPWAIVVGLAFALVRFLLALQINPVSYRYIRRFSERRINHRIEVPLVLVDVEPTIESSAAAFLESVNMDWLATVGDDAGLINELQVYRSEDRVVLGALSEDGTQPLFLSRLDDGRIVVTTTTFMPFRQGIIVNIVRRGLLRHVLESHVDALDLALRDGAELGRVDADSVIHVLSSEQDSWTQLGPFVGPFISLTAKWKPHLLLTRFSPSRLLEMSIEVPTERPVMHLPATPEALVEPDLVEAEVEAPEADEPAVVAAVVIEQAEIDLDEQVEATPMPEPAPLWPLPEPIRVATPSVEADLAPIVIEMHVAEPMLEPLAQPDPVPAPEVDPQPVVAVAAPTPVPNVTEEPLPEWSAPPAQPLVIGRRAEHDAA